VSRDAQNFVFFIASRMSRFFRGDSDSDSDSSSSSSSSFSSEDDVPAARQQAPAPTSRYVFSDEEGSDDVKRVVKSAKDKRFEELRACVKSLDNAKKINDWVALSNGNLLVVL
jgi:translation initiation factor 3 subunit C